jgi:hypothetical protein
MIWTTATSARAALDRAEDHYCRANPRAEGRALQALQEAEEAFCVAVVGDLWTASGGTAEAPVLPSMEPELAALVTSALAKLDVGPFEGVAPAAALGKLLQHMWSGGSVRSAYVPLTALYRRMETD